MKKSIIFFILLCTILAQGFIGVADTVKYIPESSTAVVTLTNMIKDTGLNWIFSAYLNQSRESHLRNFLKTVGLDELSVAIFPPQGEYPIYMIIVLELSATSEIDSGLLHKLILNDTTAKGAEVKELEHKGKTINYALNKPIKDEISAYCILNKTIVLATDSDLCKKAIDGPSVVDNENYKKSNTHLTGSQDCVYFAENKEARFANFLKPLEERWKLSLLLSVEDLQWMGSSFDIVDSNKATGEIIFSGADKLEMADIIDDADFIGEAFKRKFSAEKIKYTGNVEVAENRVKLKFQLEGLEPLWSKLFAEGVINSVISK